MHLNVFTNLCGNIEIRAKSVFCLECGAILQADSIRKLFSIYQTRSLFLVKKLVKVSFYRIILGEQHLCDKVKINATVDFVRVLILIR